MPSTLAAPTELPVITKEQAESLVRDHRVPVDGYGKPLYFIYCLAGTSSMPTEAEIRILQSYCEYTCLIYYQSARERILSAPLPVCAGHNTVEFFRGATASHGTSGWSYRRNSWRSGPYTIPVYNQEPPPPWTLVQVLDHIERVELGVAAKWLQWKADRPDIFSGAE